MPRPSFLEHNLHRGAGASIKQHYLFTYARSFAAVIRGQFQNKAQDECSRGALRQLVACRFVQVCCAVLFAVCLCVSLCCFWCRRRIWRGDVGLWEQTACLTGAPSWHRRSLPYMARRTTRCRWRSIIALHSVAPPLLFRSNPCACTHPLQDLLTRQLNFRQGTLWRLRYNVPSSQDAAAQAALPSFTADDILDGGGGGEEEEGGEEQSSWFAGADLESGQG